MVDCSHGNSRKLHSNQPLVASDLVCHAYFHSPVHHLSLDSQFAIALFQAKQISAGNENLFGLMIESNLKEGAQKIIPGKPLQYGVSVTDACIDWDTTVTAAQSSLFLSFRLHVDSCRLLFILFVVAFWSSNADRFLFMFPSLADECASGARGGSSSATCDLGRQQREGRSHGRVGLERIQTFAAMCYSEL